MRGAFFTPEELEELRRADAEIDAEFMITREEREAGNKRDRRCRIENSYGSAAAQREYYEANREKIAAAQRGDNPSVGFADSSLCTREP